MFRFLTLLLVIISVASGCKDRSASFREQTSGSWSEGSKPPAFELKGLDEKLYTLDSLRGKVVLVNFWATWCPPCVAEMGSFERVYQQLRGDNFEMISINVDSRDSLPEVRSFIKDNGISFPVLLDPDMKVASSWGLSGYPETFFIGRDGSVLAYYDLEDNKKTTRVLADRPWDNPRYIEEIKKLINATAPSPS